MSDWKSKYESQPQSKSDWKAQGTQQGSAESKPAPKAPAKKAETKPKAKAKKAPAKKRAPRKKAAKKVDPIVKHDASEHKGNTTSSRPDLEPQKADKAFEEVRKIRADNEARAATHNRVTTDTVVDTVSGTLRVRAADRLVYVDAKDAVLDQDGAINLRHAVEAAFQAVS